MRNLLGRTGILNGKGNQMMHAIRRIGSALVNGAYGKPLFTVCASIITVAAFTAFPVAASATSAHPAAVSTAAYASAPSIPSLCYNPPNSGEEFDRCTGTTWAGTGCEQNENYNGTNGPFNVLAAHNGCFVRVWLHQDDWNGSNWGNGWTYCIAPGAYDTIVPSAYQHPLNIYVSSNSSSC
jgi:hypothetical protein